MKPRKSKVIARLVTLGVLAIPLLLPIIYTITNSFMGDVEILKYYNAVTNKSSGTVFHLFPDEFTFTNYFGMLVKEPTYLFKFWNSLLLTCSIVFGQVAISFLAGYAFAKTQFWGSKTAFTAIIILMLMPYQVTLVSNYIILDSLNLIGTYWAIILPGIFAPFGVFLMRQVILTMPDNLIDSAHLDGASELQLMMRIVLPYNKSGVISLIILCFIDNWNMIEQPLVFLEKSEQYPLSVLLAQMNNPPQGIGFACSVLVMIPVLLLFLYSENELMEGIAFSNLK